MKTKQVLAGAVATAFVAPVAALAAIDDQGMQYVSASEGLGGSLRVDVLIDSDAEGEDVSSKTNSLRLWTAGDIDLGGGMQSTYYIELRDRGGGESDVYVDAYDIGLKGPFGHVTFGHLGMVAFRLTPSASLAFERGTERAAFGADPGPNGIRYESPVINGFQFGVSGRLDGSGGPDGSLDEYSLGVKYTLPIGLEVGAGYELEDVTAMADEYDQVLDNVVSYQQVITTVSVTIDPSSGNPSATVTMTATVTAGHIDDENPITIAMASGSTLFASESGALVKVERPAGTDYTLPAAWGDGTEKASDSMSGFRFGARYGQDNWLVAYEYRGYEGFKPVNIADYGTQDLQIGIGADEVVDESLIGALDFFIQNGDKGLDYAVHAVGAQAKVDRVTMSAGYSMEENTYEGSLVLAGGEITLERDTISIDAVYALGSKSHMVIGWRQHDYSSTVNPFNHAAATVNGSRDVSETYLFYRVDF